MAGSVSTMRMSKVLVRPCLSRKVRQQTVALFGSSAPAKGSFYEYEVKNIDGKPVKLDQFKGKVVLVVNLASQVYELPLIHGIYMNMYMPCLLTVWKSCIVTLTSTLFVWSLNLHARC
ncbi:hypothetical protein CEUSTIGMA_g8101.t1 [Chlamydomonas eustigma]|uniref:Glutathione peroxidase n=1 Tax=Chlamydomonas eustigma TaxID=1157962 RepID=A0A250XC83_9CHLO|nr:hypothetical protein CEUSTIGMA_g8101.t1 [Chlamydomonas eustigma]|eukprot:GAX80666.1 hypothetical protein CEUSTIGMA_g8101.t1 [Chlamydomonas eustigma]